MSERDGIAIVERRLKRLEACPPVLLGWSVTQAKMRLLREIIAEIRALPLTEPDDPTAEMVEAGARAAYVEMAMVSGERQRPWDQGTDECRAVCRMVSEAVLRAARPAGGRKGGA